MQIKCIALKKFAYFHNISNQKTFCKSKSADINHLGCRPCRGIPLKSVKN